MSDNDIKVELATQFLLALYRVLEKRGFSLREIECLQSSDTPVDAIAMELADYMIEDRRIGVLLEDAQHWADCECLDG